MNKDKTLRHLVQSLIDNNVIDANSIESGRLTVNNWMKRGILTLRERPSSGWKVITDSEIEEIVLAFRPGGSGQWHFKQ